MAKIKLKKTAAKADNTSVKKPIVKEVGPSYNYMNQMADKTTGKPSSKDSSDYRRGFNKALSSVERNPLGKRIIGGKYEYGPRVVGLNDRFNEGFSEGKDKALKKNGKQKEIMAKVKMKKPIEYNTIVPRPKDRTQKGQLIVGKQF